MNVLHLLPTFDEGGLGALGLELLRSWPKGDSHVVVASRFPATKPNMRAAFDRHLGAERVRDCVRSLMHPMGFVDGLRDTIRGLADVHGKFDAAIIYNFFDHVWYTMALRRTGFTGKLICHVGTVLNPSGDIEKMFGSPFTLGITFVPCSLAVRDGLVLAGANPKTVSPAVWNGVDLKAFPIKPYVNHGGPVTFGFVGRMAPGAKDWEALLRGYALLEDDAASRARLVLAGEGPMRSKLERLCDELGLVPGSPAKRGVRFLGSVSRSDIPTFLWSLDVFVMAALPIEGFSMALVEAVATGLPVIATDVPANRELLHGRAGTLVEGAKGIADGMKHMMSAEERGMLAAESAHLRTLLDVRAVATAYRNKLTD